MSKKWEDLYNRIPPHKRADIELFVEGQLQKWTIFTPDTAPCETASAIPRLLMGEPYKVHEYDEHNHMADVIGPDALGNGQVLVAYTLPTDKAERSAMLLNKGFAAGVASRDERVKALEDALESLCDSCDAWVTDLGSAEGIACAYERARELLKGGRA